MRRGIRVLLFSCATLLQALPMAQAAEPWPSKTIRMVIPLPPGGGGDAAARIIAAELSVRLPHPTIVENRGGAGGIIGTQAVAQASPDGHTLLFTTDFHTINGALGKLPYDSVKDFAPVTQLVELQLVMLARPGLEAKTLQEVVSLARTKPKQVTFGTPGVGSPHFLAVKLSAPTEL